MKILQLLFPRNTDKFRTMFEVIEYLEKKNAVYDVLDNGKLFHIRSGIPASDLFELSLFAKRNGYDLYFHAGMLNLETR